MAEKQVKSRERVEQHGEVFTNEREVKAMCDLVANECDRIDSRFLEPACGNGNFLAEVLSRKLATVKKMYKSNHYDYERYSILAVSSIYGVELLQDNVTECVERLFEQWNEEYTAVCKKDCNEAAREAVRFILNCNILCGNALTLMCVDENQQDTEEPIIFPEWSMLMGTKLKRRDFRLDVLLKANESPSDKPKQSSLFTDEISQYLTTNPVTGEYMPLPIREYPPVHYKQISKTGE